MHALGNNPFWFFLRFYCSFKFSNVIEKEYKVHHCVCIIQLYDTVKFNAYIFMSYDIIFFFLLQSSFFIAYVVTSGWTSTSSELFRLIPLIGSLITKPCKSADDELEAPTIPYHRDIPRLLFFGLLGITYFFLAPLILPFLLVYFCLGYIIYRNQVSWCSLSKFFFGYTSLVLPKFIILR